MWRSDALRTDFGGRRVSVPRGLGATGLAKEGRTLVGASPLPWWGLRPSSGLTRTDPPHADTGDSPAGAGIIVRKESFVSVQKDHGVVG